MIFTFKRCIGVEVLHGKLIDPRFDQPCNAASYVLKILQLPCTHLFIDDGEGHGSAQWQVLPAADLLEVRDGDAVVWRAP